MEELHSGDMQFVIDRKTMSAWLCSFVPRGGAMFPDALEEAGRVEGLPLSAQQPSPEQEEEEGGAPAVSGPKRRGRYRQSLQLLKPFRITHK